MSFRFDPSESLTLPNVVADTISGEKNTNVGTN